MLTLSPTQKYRITCSHCRRKCIKPAKTANEAQELAKNLGWTLSDNAAWCPTCSINPQLKINRRKQ